MCGPSELSVWALCMGHLGEPLQQPQGSGAIFHGVFQPAPQSPRTDHLGQAAKVPPRCVVTTKKNIESSGPQDFPSQCTFLVLQKIF